MQTPINMAIEALREQAQQFADLKLFSKFEAVSDTCNYLESLLPIEHQFARECFDAGKIYGIDSAMSCEDGLPPIEPDFTQFIQQFNGEKK